MNQRESNDNGLFPFIFIIFLIVAMIILIIVINKKIQKETPIATTEEETLEVETTTSIEPETSKPVEEDEIITKEETTIAATTAPIIIDHEKEITSIQYTLGEGVRARLLPSNDGEIFKVIYDIYSEVGVISEGEDWYKCCIDNTICYISSRYIGDEEDVKYVKDKREKQAALDKKRKSSAYYEIFKNMTSDEYELLAKIVALEAGDQSFEGRVAVVEVIMNRCISKNPCWPNNTKNVIYQRGQFSTVAYLSHPYNTPHDIDYDAINFVKDNGATVLRSKLDEAGYSSVSSLDYVYFATYHANGVSPVIRIGGHYFARESNKKYQRSR